MKPFSASEVSDILAQYKSNNNCLSPYKEPIEMDSFHQCDAVLDNVIETRNKNENLDTLVAMLKCLGNITEESSCSDKVYDTLKEENDIQAKKDKHLEKYIAYAEKLMESEDSTRSKSSIEISSVLGTNDTIYKSENDIALLNDIKKIRCSSVGDLKAVLESLTQSKKENPSINTANRSTSQIINTMLEENNILQGEESCSRAEETNLENMLNDLKNILTNSTDLQDNININTHLCKDNIPDVSNLIGLLTEALDNDTTND